jgi:UPF0176 protein
MQLRNKYDKKTLKKRLDDEKFDRITLSFYRYVILEDIESFRDELYRLSKHLESWAGFSLPGRYQCAVICSGTFPGTLRMLVDSIPQFAGVPFKIAVEENRNLFISLSSGFRPKIVGDGLEDDTFDVTV